MQSFDFTSLMAICAELRRQWLPARIEQIYQTDRYTLSLALRTLEKQRWLTLCWHPQWARLCLTNPPPKIPDTFTLSDQLRHQLKGLALIALDPVEPWERVLDLKIAPRPDDPPQYHLYLEIMGKYSNLILCDDRQQIISVAHQVNAQQSRVRTVLTGQPYTLPPTLLGTVPNRGEAYLRWQERLSLIPGSLKKQLVKNYRGVSPMVAQSLLAEAGLNADMQTTELTPEQWQGLFLAWHHWLQILDDEQFQPGWTPSGYTVLGVDLITPATDVNSLINAYYGDRHLQEQFSQLKHQLQQKVRTLSQKLQHKADTFRQRLAQSEQADQWRLQADLLMAHPQQWSPGMTEILLTDFESGNPVKIPLRPDKTAIQNAQAFYKQHQKLKRAKGAVLPLLEAVEAEIHYLEQVAASLEQGEAYTEPEDLQALEEIQDELIEQKYLESASARRRRKADDFHPHQHISPSGFPIWIGRNNRQNDYLSFRIANDYDLWFHSQEIPGSHVLLRLPPGAIAEGSDLQCAADWAAYHSRARESEQVPVIFTKPKYVFKPKGAKPGMVIYKQESVLWGRPANIPIYRQTTQ